MTTSANTIATGLPRYDIARTYDWNYEHAPEAVEVEVPAMHGSWDFCGLGVASPLGIAAGPLLNGRWLLYYAALGFDVLTYKTVRREGRASYDWPNLVPVEASLLSGTEASLLAADSHRTSWAISFGMPSRPREVWQADVRATRRALAPGKLLSVSVVATPDDDAGIEHVAADYAECAAAAVAAGADCVEANFSCPNVASCDGQLFTDAAASAIVARRIREAIGGTPLIIKIGHVTHAAGAARLVEALAPFVDALAMVNTLSTKIVGADGSALFDGQRRGIGGRAIHEAAVRQVELFAEAIVRTQARMRIVGVGGASDAADVRRFLAAGAHAVHLATAAMLDPGVGLSIRRAWGEAAKTRQV